jgi:hypothetical protein
MRHARRRSLVLVMLACALTADADAAADEEPQQAGPQELAQLTLAIDALQPLVQNLEAHLQQCHREQLQVLVSEAASMLEHAHDPAVNAVAPPRSVNDFPIWYLWSLAQRWGCTPWQGEVAWAREYHAAREAERPSDRAYEEALVCLHHLQHLRERLRRQLQTPLPPHE